VAIMQCAQEDPSSVQLPLVAPDSLLTMRRNIEKMTLASLGSLNTSLFFSYLEMKGSGNCGNCGNGGNGGGGLDSGGDIVDDGVRRTGGNSGGGGGYKNDGETTTDGNDRLTASKELKEERKALKELFVKQEESIRKMLSVVLVKETIDAFLYELVQGRFVGVLNVDTRRILKGLFQNE
jgi:hypothetical protein